MRASAELRCFGVCFSCAGSLIAQEDINMLKRSARAELTVFSLSVGFLLVSSSALAQVDTGAILGTVTDPSGAVVPGAKVTATNLGTRLALSTTTSGVGSYEFTSMRIGNYSITVEKEGFEQPKL
jgi:Carboxypeptidase regulatory-like domain